MSLLVGIDPGVHTGFAVYCKETRQLVGIETGTAVKIEEKLLAIRDKIKSVYIEDARLRTWFGKAGKEVLQGVGSVKRDCARWMEFCEHHGIKYKAIHPKTNKTKLSADQFDLITGYCMRTSQHARDAAMLVFGL